MRRIVIEFEGVLPVITMEGLNTFEAMGLLSLAAALMKDKMILEAYEAAPLAEEQRLYAC